MGTTRYAIVEHGTENLSFDIYTEFGGFANIYHEEGSWRSQYFQESWKDTQPDMMTRSTIRDWGAQSLSRNTLVLDAIEYMHASDDVELHIVQLVSLEELTNPMTKEQAIVRVKDSASSIFSKDDVLAIINGIAAPEPTLDTETLGMFVTELYDILGDIKNGRGITASDQIEFKIYNGNEIHVEDLELDTDDLRNKLEDVLDRMTEIFLTEE